MPSRVSLLCFHFQQGPRIPSPSTFIIYSLSTIHIFSNLYLKQFSNIPYRYSLMILCFGSSFFLKFESRHNIHIHDFFFLINHLQIYTKLKKIIYNNLAIISLKSPKLIFVQINLINFDRYLIKKSLNMLKMHIMLPSISNRCSIILILLRDQNFLHLFVLTIIAFLLVKKKEEVRNETCSCYNNKIKCQRQNNLLLSYPLYMHPVPIWVGKERRKKI